MQATRQATLAPTLQGNGVIVSLKVIFIFILLITTGDSQIDNFYANLQSLFASSLTDVTTPRLNSFKPNHINANFDLNMNSRSSGFPNSKSFASSKLSSSHAPKSGSPVTDINSWTELPSDLFQSAQSKSRAPPRPSPASSFSFTQGTDAIHQLSSFLGGSHDYTGSQSINPGRAVQQAVNNFSPDISGGPDGGGGQGGAGGFFLPLADHSGSMSADDPHALYDWSAPPITEDTFQYPEAPKKPVQHFSNGESMAKAILEGKVKRWEWNYSSSALGGEIGSHGHGEKYHGSMTCCQRLPYICGVDGMCVLDKARCQEFCICTVNPDTTHCIKMLPVIKWTMKNLERKMLAKVAKNLNVSYTTVALPTLLTPSTTTKQPSTERPVVGYITIPPPPEIIRPSLSFQHSWNLRPSDHVTVKTEILRRNPADTTLPMTTESETTTISTTSEMKTFPLDVTNRPAVDKATPQSTVGTRVWTTSAETKQPVSTTNRETSTEITSLPTSTSTTKPQTTPITTAQTTPTTTSNLPQSSEPPTTIRAATESSTEAAATSETPLPTDAHIVHISNKAASTPHTTVGMQTTASTTLTPSSTSRSTSTFTTSTTPQATTTTSHTTESDIDTTKTTTTTTTKSETTSQFTLASTSPTVTEKSTTIATAFPTTTRKPPHKTEPSTPTTRPLSSTTILSSTVGKGNPVTSTPLPPSDEQRENDLLSWFKSNSQFSTQETTTSPTLSSQVNTTFPSYVGEDDYQKCMEKCLDYGGTCVLGEDFKPQCVKVTDDACDHFQCINGDCVSIDGLYSCQCYQNWTGIFCDELCDLDCGQYGHCGRVDEFDTIGCICQWNFTGPFCTEIKEIVTVKTDIIRTGNEFKTWEVAVMAVVVAVLLALTCVVLPYLLWRRQWLPMRKLIFYFQDYEDDDNKEYDAFVSYKSCPRDERFVLHHLYPRLEKELDFRLCLHFRDFSPGDTIANNIIHAVQNSRRTILVLSPSYVESEWCRMEYQMAQHEMLKLKHKIIPVILEDVRGIPDMDKNLRTIIESVTYINWPGEEPLSSKWRTRFWRLLELAMPKKKSEYSRSISSSGSCASDLPLTPAAKTCFDSIADAVTSEGYMVDKSGSENSYSTAKANGVSSGSHISSEPVDNALLHGIHFPDPPAKPTAPVLFPVERNDSLTPSIARACSSSMYLGSDDTEPEITSCSTFSSEGSPRLTSSILTRSSFNATNARQAGNRWQPPKENSNPKREEEGSTILEPFLTSDDHIIEIRDVGKNVIKVTPRPRKQDFKLFL